MPGPGEYRPDSTVGIFRTEDSPKTKVSIRSRNDRRRPCPQCGHSVDRDRLDPEDLQLLMIEAGAIWTPFGVQHRFPNQEMAADAYARLMEEMPVARWSIVKSSFGPIME